MILDIDIRVSNDNGIQVQQFTKHFDSRFEGTSGIGSTNNSTSKGFEEFLAEFLTSSGRVIRNNLITEQTAISNSPNTAFSNVEYTLKLGDSQSVTGSIPLDKLFRLGELSKINNQLENQNNNLSPSFPTIIDHNQLESPQDSSEHLVLKRTIFKTPTDLTDVDEMFRQFITTAVNRYENSFYVEDIVDSNFTEIS